jgi:uncharacterized protein with PQ loop repeat
MVYRAYKYRTQFVYGIRAVLIFLFIFITQAVLTVDCNRLDKARYSMDLTGLASLACLQSFQN